MAEQGRSRTNPAQFVRQVRQETAKVTWPSRKETGLSTLMVLVMVALTAVFFFILDQIFALLVGFVFSWGG